ncbi:hypothetical protein [Mycolicibacterium sp. 624]|uniref:hypothetical protein n=1 Tax=Mycolicibacterium sp. 624 TaxID=3156314 RepID=UPI00339458FA
MTGRQRTRASSTTNAARMTLAGVAVSLGALVLAGPAAAEPVDPAVPVPVPMTPGAPPPAPGQPVIVAADDPAPPPAPPPVGEPMVPEVANQVYGSGKSSGPLGFLRDAWHQAQDPYGFQGMAPGEMPAATPPPPGAGAAPPLPPGYQSLTDPASNGPAPTASYEGGPPLPEGYYSLNGPPPPGYFDGPPPAPAPVPGGYQPVVSPPPPPLLPTP